MVVAAHGCMPHACNKLSRSSAAAAAYSFFFSYRQSRISMIFSATPSTALPLRKATLGAGSCRGRLSPPHEDAHTYAEFT